MIISGVIKLPVMMPYVSIHYYKTSRVSCQTQQNPSLLPDYSSTVVPFVKFKAT